jgi:predicted transcriptional regulator
MSAKEQVAELLRRLPDDVELPEIAREIDVLAAIRVGEDQADAGRLVAHDEVKRQFYSWFTEPSGPSRP